MQQSEESLEWWEQCWEKGNIFWQLPSPHKFLVTYFDQCKTSEHPKVLIPLIGSTVDAKWLYDKGCEVTGVEISELGIQRLYDQHNIAYTRVQTDFPEFVLYYNDDRKIRTFAGDLFNFSKDVAGTQFDFIWDRGSLTAINLPDRERYAAVLKNVLAPNGTILVSALNYDSSKYHGPPHYVTSEHMDHFFGKYFTVQLLEKRSVFQPWQKQDWGIDWLEEVAYLLKWKDNKA